jgi:hypothetical protein
VDPISKSTGFFAGILGALVMALLEGFARTLGLLNQDASLPLILGSWLTHSMGTGTRFIGLLPHALLGGLFGLVYADLLSRTEEIPSAGGGALIGVIHAGVGGVLVGLVPVFHPLMPSPLPPPGAFMSASGLVGMLTFVALHGAYGGIIGGVGRRYWGLV